MEIGEDGMVTFPGKDQVERDDQIEHGVEPYDPHPAEDHQQEILAEPAATRLALPTFIPHPAQEH